MEGTNPSHVISSTLEITTTVISSVPEITTVIPSASEMATIPPPTFTLSPTTVNATIQESLSESDLVVERRPSERTGRLEYPNLDDWVISDSRPTRAYHSTTTGPLLSTRMAGVSTSSLPAGNTTSQTQMPSFLATSSHDNGTDTVRQPTPVISQPSTQTNTQDPIVEILRRLAEATQPPPPPPPPPTDFLSQLVAALRPAP